MQLLLVISDFLLSETDALTPETLSEANVCLRTALIDDVNTAEFEVLSGHFQSVAERLALLAARDYAKWSKAVIDFVRHATRVSERSDHRSLNCCHWARPGWAGPGSAGQGRAELGRAELGRAELGQAGPGQAEPCRAGQCGRGGGY